MLQIKHLFKRDKMHREDVLTAIRLFQGYNLLYQNELQPLNHFIE